MLFARFPKFNHSATPKPVILVAPLDWGLGHATRCIPLIHHLLTIGCEIIIASEGSQYALLKQEFASLRHVHLKGYRLQYGKNSWHTQIKLLLQIPKILISIKRENRWLVKFLTKNRVDAIISDNRFGLHTKTMPAIFITHQLMIKTRFGKTVEKYLQKLNYSLIQKFTACWIPDYEGQPNFGGELSHPRVKPLIPVKYLGRVTRIHAQPQTVDCPLLLILISGPEPQRTIFEELLLKQLTGYDKPAVLVRGLPGEAGLVECGNKNVIIHNHLSSSAMNTLIHKSDIIISRSGYSTVLDVVGLHKKCIFIPTPGQPEQEYLARYLEQNQLCISYIQNDFSLAKALSKLAMHSPLPFYNNKVNSYAYMLEDLVTGIVMRKGTC